MCVCVAVLWGNWFMASTSTDIQEGIWLEEMTRRDVVDKPEVAGLALGPLSST